MSIKIYDDRKINLNKHFSYAYGFSFNATDQTLLESWIAKNDKATSTLIVYAFDDGIETHHRIYTGGIKSDVTLSIKANDELTSINLELIDDSTNANALNFKIPNRSRVRMFFDVPTTSVVSIISYLSYTTNYKDLVVAGGTFASKTEPNGREVYYHGYNFVEPMYLLRNIIVGTNTCTNLESLTTYDSGGNPTTYSQEPTNAYEALVRILKIAEIETTQYSKVLWYRFIIDNNTKTLLEKTAIGQNFYYNQTNLSDILFKIFALANRTPELKYNSTYSPNNTVTPNSREFILQCKPESTATYNDTTLSNLNVTNYIVNDMTEKQASKIVCEASNMGAANGVIDSNKHLMIDDLGKEMKFFNGGTLTDVASDCYVMTEYPIKDGIEVEIEYYVTGAEVEGTKIAPLVTKNEWMIMNTTQQKKTAYYDPNEPQKVKVWDLIKDYTSAGQLMCSFNIKYVPLITCTVANGSKYGFTEAIAQEDSAVNAESFGDYLDQYAERNSGLNIQFQAIHNTYSSILELGGKLNTFNNTFEISEVNITFKNGYYVVSYAANIEEAVRSENIGYDSTTNNKWIDSSLLKERQISFTDSVILDAVTLLNSDTSTNIGTWEQMYVNDSGFKTMLYEMFHSIITSSTIDGLYFKESKHTFRRSQYSQTLTKTLLTSKYGKSILMMSKMDTSKYNITGGVTRYVNPTDHNYGVTTTTNYCDTFAKADEMDFSIVHTISELSQNYDTLVSVTNAKIYKDTYEKLTTSFQLDILEGNIKITDEFYKLLFHETDTNEIWNLAWMETTNKDDALEGSVRAISSITKNNDRSVRFGFTSSITPTKNWQHLVLVKSSGTITYYKLLSYYEPTKASFNRFLLSFRNK